MAGKIRSSRNFELHFWPILCPSLNRIIMRPHPPAPARHDCYDRPNKWPYEASPDPPMFALWTLPLHRAASQPGLGLWRRNRMFEIMNIFANTEIVRCSKEIEGYLQESMKPDPPPLLSLSDANISKFLCLINSISYAPKYLKNCHLHISLIFCGYNGLWMTVSISIDLSISGTTFMDLAANVTNGKK